MPAPFLFFVFILLAPGTLKAQPEIDFIRVIGTDSPDNCTGLCLTNLGGFSLAGRTARFFDENSSSDILIFTIDSTGSESDRHAYGNGGYQAAYAITRLSNDDMLVSGTWGTGFAMRIAQNGEQVWWRSFDFDGTLELKDIVTVNDDLFALYGNINSGNSWLVIINGEGDIINAVTYHENEITFSNKLCSTADGSFALVGSYSSDNENGSEAMAMKVNDQGEEIWYTTFGTEFEDYGTTVTEDRFGNFYIGGYSRDGVRNYQGFIAKLDHNGQLVWLRQNIADSDAINTTIISALDGTSVLVAGEGDGTIEIDDRIRPAQLWMAKINPEGEITWQIDNEARTLDRGFKRIVELSDHSYVAAGSGYRDYRHDEPRDQNFILVKTTPDPLAAEPAELSSAPSYDFGDTFVDSLASYELTVTNSGRRYAEILSADITLGQQAFAVEYGEIPRLFPGDSTTLVVGFSPDSAIAYAGVLSIFFGADTVVDTLEVDLTGVGIPNVGVAEEAVNAPSLTALLEVSPNPFNSTLTIRYTGGLETTATRLGIYDINGREVVDLLSSTGVSAGQEFHPAAEGGATGSHFVTWDASSQPAGVYFVRLQSGSEILTEKVVLLR